MKNAQLELITKRRNPSRRKVARELSTRNPMHLIFRSTKAVGGLSFLHPKNRTHLHQLIHQVAARHGIRILACELNGNHAHLLIQGKSRTLLKAFFRHLPQAVMFLITGAKKGCAKGPFFDAPIFTRIVYWGRDLRQTKDYLWKNLMEAMGLPSAAISEWRKGWAEQRQLLKNQLAKPERRIHDPSPLNLSLF